MATALPLRWLEADSDHDSLDVRCHELTICDALHSDIANVHHDENATGPKQTFEEACAYARLFVAAPELLAAVKLAKEEIEYELCGRRSPALDAIDVALAKLEGRS
ncbi:hypothetical protein [uncultured Alsobacter sp.]|uniref:hypothetical protein n=1 Tax=uncultured Alsobacter sp. TaxID=1748258 RepID=UPI0025CC1DFC|nr:hypothetical protein [uncultured Alsobacter sp.]